MIATGLFTDEIATQALAVLGFYGCMLLGSPLSYG
jgi:hypothetical protein